MALRPIWLPRYVAMWLKRRYAVIHGFNVTIITVSPPIYAIGEKRREKISGLQRDSNP